MSNQRRDPHTRTPRTTLSSSLTPSLNQTHQIIMSTEIKPTLIPARLEVLLKLASALPDPGKPSSLKQDEPLLELSQLEIIESTDAPLAFNLVNELFLDSGEECRPLGGKYGVQLAVKVMRRAEPKNQDEEARLMLSIARLTGKVQLV